MKLWIWMTGGIGVAAVAAGLVWLDPFSSSNDKQEQEADGRSASALIRPNLSPEQQAKVEEDIDSLLSDDSPAAWAKIAALYKVSNEATKRKVLAHISKTKDLKLTVNQVLSTVGDDPTPPEADPMIAEAAEMLKDRWRTTQDLQYGRQMMLMQKSEKRQWVVAKALITFAKGIDADSELTSPKHRINAKLVDLHSTMHNTYIKSEIVQGVRDLGGEDAALILAQGTAVADEDLEVVRSKAAAREAVLNNTP